MSDSCGTDMPDIPERFQAVLENRIVGHIIDAPPELKAFLVARSRGAPRAELMRLQLAAQMTPARSERMKQLKTEER